MQVRGVISTSDMLETGVIGLTQLSKKELYHSKVAYMELRYVHTIGCLHVYCMQLCYSYAMNPFYNGKSKWVAHLIYCALHETT